MIKNGYIRDALETADKILIDMKEKFNSKALCVKAEAMYNLGNFEHSLLCFHSALRTANIKVRQDKAIYD